MDPDEARRIVETYPEATQFIKPYIGAKDFLHGGHRRCLWLRGCDIEAARRIPEIDERLKRVANFRAASSAAPTRRKAEQPHLFFSSPQTDDPYLVIPRHSSERRTYIPIGFESPNNIASDAVSIVAAAEVYHFGILHSQVHNAWMRTVAGRLESRYRYSGGVVYNTFPWPNPTFEQKERIEQCAQAVLDARENHLGKSLADLYDPDKMPADLLSAHKALDAAVEAAYGVNFNGDEEKIVAHLFKLYAELTQSNL